MWFFERFVPDFSGFSEQKWFFERFVPELTSFSEQSDEFQVFRGVEAHPSLTWGICPACGRPHPLVTESNANPGAWLRLSFCLAAHPYKSKLLTGAPPNKNAALSCGAHICIALRGERGIRTPGTLPYTCFRGRLLQPLGHLTKRTANIAIYLQSQNPYILFTLSRKARTRSTYSSGCFA